MNELESKNEKPKEGHRFEQELLKKGMRCDLDQYEFLRECSKKGAEGIKQWNEWRNTNFGIEIYLEGTHNRGAYLEGANLFLANLKGTSFYEANLKNADLRFADLEDVDLFKAHLENTKLAKTILKNASLSNANLQGVQIWSANLENACLSSAHLENTNFSYAYLKGACLDESNLQGASFQQAFVDGMTSIWNCKVDRDTHFMGVALNSVCIDPRTKQLLEYNIRRMNWEAWYNEQHWSLRWLVRKFWKISDYGMSTKQIIKTFFKLAFVFAIIYYIWGFIDYYLVGIKDYPGIVSDLFVLEDKQEAVSRWLVPFRAVYFSIVTMTTLGFGDMYANAHSFLRGLLGHVLLALQVILGYVLLGALVTRFAVLFTAGGPAGRFADEKKNRNKTTEKIKN